MKSDPVAAEHGIAMRAGIGVGEFTALQLGGLGGRWELAFVGEPLAQVGAAQTASALGKVALSPEAWLSLTRAVGGQSDVDAPPQPMTLTPELIDPVPERPAEPFTLPPEADDALWSYIPSAVRARLVAGQAEWIGELRRVTVMFVDVPALAAGPALSEAQQMIRELQGALEHYEGSFHKLSVDEKGVKLIGVFGLPPVSHESDPVRAVLAARDMLDRLKRIGVTCSIGVTTGRAFCGVLGGEHRRDYTVIGDIVNLAARLMHAAQGGILCDEETYSASQMRVAFRASRPIAIKGKAEPVTAYSPTGEHIDAMAVPTALPGHSSAMVGRSAESAVLADMLTGLLNGHGQVIVIEGEAGIGKSRLVEHLLDEASARGVRSLFGAGDAIENASPYRTWRPILGQLLRLDRLPPDREAQRNHVVEALRRDEQLAQLTPLLNAILPLDTPNNDLTVAMDADVRADNIQLMVTRLVQQAADDSPLLLVFDDAQWLDPSSWQLARHVCQSVRPLAAVVAARPFDQPLPSEYQAFRRVCSPRAMVLGSLPPTDIATLVHSTLGVESLPDEVMDLLRDKAEGHPLFSKELAYYLRNEGVVVTAPPAEPGRLPRGRLAPDANLTEVTFPDTVQVVVTSRIDRLDARQQLMLKVAGVIGRVFSVNALQDVLPVETDPARFAADLNRLEEADLIAIDRPAADATYAFTHTIIQEVAYSQLLFANRRELHGAVAQWYERMHGDELDRYVSVLAHHWTMADDAPRAIKYQALAGEQALASFANEEAITFLKRALDLSDTSEHGVDRTARAGWELHMGEAQIHWSRYVEGRRHLERGLALLDHPVPHAASTAARAWYLSRALGKQWRNRLFRHGRLVSEPGARAKLLRASRAYTRLVEAAFLSGDQWLALYSSVHALNLAETTGPSRELAEAYGPVGISYGAIPWRSEAKRYLDRAVDTARQVGSPAALGYTLLVCGTHAVGAAEWDTARAMSSALVDLGHRVGARKRLSDGLQLLTSLSYSQGQFEQCVAAADELLASATRGHDPRFSAYGYFAKAYGALYLGRLNEALALLTEIPALLGSETTDRMLELMYLGLLGAVYLRLGRADEALEAAVSAQEHQAGPLLDLGYSLPGYAQTAEVLLELWRSRHPGPDLPRMARQACRSLRRFARLYEVGRPYATLYQGAYAWLAGQPGRAVRRWRASASSAQQLGMPYVEGRAHLELARSLSGDAADRDEHLRSACRIFDQLQTPAEYEQAEELLKQSGRLRGTEGPESP